MPTFALHKPPPVESIPATSENAGLNFPSTQHLLTEILMSTERTPKSTKEPPRSGWNIGDVWKHFDAAKAGYTAFGFCIAGTFWLWSIWFPTSPTFLITGAKGAFAIPHFVDWTMMRAEGDNSDDLKEHLKNVTNYAEFHIRNKGKKAFKNLQLNISQLGHIIVAWTDQEETEHFPEHHKKHIKLNDLNSGQEIHIQIWSEKPIPSSNPPILSHDEGSASLSVPVELGWIHVVNTAFMVGAMVFMSQSGHKIYHLQQEIKNLEKLH
jgi:hypothetical protein